MFYATTIKNCLPRKCVTLLLRHITFLSGYICSDTLLYVCSDTLSLTSDINYVDRGAADPRRCNDEEWLYIKWNFVRGSFVRWCPPVLFVLYYCTVLL